MFKRTKVSFAGRLIITVIFVLTVFIPESLIMVGIHNRQYEIGFWFIRIVGECVLYYFTMLGRGWARWITAFCFIILTAMVIGATGRRNPHAAIVAAILYIPSIAILLGLKSVQPRERTRSRSHTAHS